MNQTRIFATFALALIIAGVASYLVSQRLTQNSVRAAVSTQLVAMANKDLEIGARLTDADVKMGEWNGTPPHGSLSKAQDAVGRAVLYPTFKDEIILDSKLAATGAGAGLSAVIPEGMRAVSIRVDDVVAVAGFVGPGTRVDVLLTGNPGTGAVGNTMLTKTILENIQVLAAGHKIQPDAQGKPERVNVVTLLCSTEDASKVTLAASEGRIQLVLRNPTDNLKKEKSAGVGRQSLYSDLPTAAPKKMAAVRKKPEPPPLPPPPVAPPAKPPVTTIEILSGTRRTVFEVTPQAPENGANR